MRYALVISLVMWALIIWGVMALTSCVKQGDGASKPEFNLYPDSKYKIERIDDTGLPYAYIFRYEDDIMVCMMVRQETPGISCVRK